MNRIRSESAIGDIELTEVDFGDNSDRKIIFSASLIYGFASLFSIGTVVKVFGGELHVQESTHQVEQLIQHAQRHSSARLADLTPDQEEDVFATSVLPPPVWRRNTGHSRSEDLTLNGVDLRHLIEQHERMLEEVRANELGEPISLARRTERAGRIVSNLSAPKLLSRKEQKYVN